MTQFWQLFIDLYLSLAAIIRLFLFLILNRPYLLFPQAIYTKILDTLYSVYPSKFKN